MTPLEQCEKMIRLFDADAVERCLAELKDSGETLINKWVRIVAPTHPYNPTNQPEITEKKYLLLVDPNAPEEIKSKVPRG